MRIDARSEESTEGVLQVSGRLIGEWVGEFEATCRRLLKAHSCLTVDLLELTFVDIDGIESVRRLVTEGVVFVGGTAFIRQRLDLPPA